MNGKLAGKHSYGRITSGLVSQDNLAIRTVRFVRDCLQPWRDDPNRLQEQSEEKLSSQLCKFLKACARNDFPMVTFDHEEYQAGRRRVDLSVSPSELTSIGARIYTIYDPILVIECKRLPPPTKDREREYVTSGEKRSGGIQRFKLGLHGADFKLVVMVGYIQARSGSDWYCQINSWIKDLLSGKMADVCDWQSTEMLMSLYEDNSKGVSNCRSLHDRTGNCISNEVEIHHLWIRMNQDSV